MVNRDFMILLGYLLLSFVSLSQQFDEVVPLSSDLGESSGLIYVNGKLITHTDSHGEPALYEIDSITGNYSRKVIVANASNDDWEDITADSTHIFIGDFGNNGGNRTNLKVYRILISDYINTPNDTVFCDTIQFSYADQNVFVYNPEATNWDCEAIVAIGDSLYLFTKNWVNSKTYVYPLSKIPGTYFTTKIDSIFVQGLITGADYHIPSNRLILCGYTQFPFVVEMNDPMGIPFGQNSFVRYNLPTSNLIQLEAVVTFDENKYYLTAETFQTIAVRLYRLEGVNGIAGTGLPEKFHFLTYPNPSDGDFTIQFENYVEDIQINIYTVEGSLVYSQDEISGQLIPINENLKSGVYQLQIKTNNVWINQKILIK